MEHSWGPVFSHLILDLKSAMTGWNNRAFDRHRLREKGISCPEGREFDLMSYWRASPKKKSTGLESNKLATVASYLQVQAPTHRALADVVAVAEIANALCKEGYDIFGDRPRKPRRCPLTQSLFDRADQVSSAAR